MGFFLNLMNYKNDSINGSDYPSSHKKVCGKNPEVVLKKSRPWSNEKLKTCLKSGHCIPY